MGCGISSASPVKSTKKAICEPDGGGDNSEIPCDQINTANNNNLPCPSPCQARNDNVEDCNVYDQSAAVATEIQGRYDILDIINDIVDERGWSASSKDSGFNDEYPNIITELSPNYKVQSVLDEFAPNTMIDLSICGYAVRKKESANSRTREEEYIIRSLQEHGLISRPTAQASGGLCFEVVTAAEEQIPRKPPPRLAKLVIKKGKKKECTLPRISNETYEKTESINVVNEEDSLSSTCYDESEDMDAKMERATKNRQQHITDICQKLKQHDHHVDLVKQRKMLHVCHEDFFDNTTASDDRLDTERVTDFMANSTAEIVSKDYVTGGLNLGKEIKYNHLNVVQSQMSKLDKNNDLNIFYTKRLDHVTKIPEISLRKNEFTDGSVTIGKAEFNSHTDRTIFYDHR